MRLNKSAADRLARMNKAAERSSSDHFTHLYKDAAVRADDGGAGDEPPSLSVVADPDPPAAAEPKAPATKKATARTPRKATEPAKASSSRTRPKAPAKPKAQGSSPSAGRSTPSGDIVPTPDVPTSERVKYSIDVTPELREALMRLLIRDVEQGRKTTQWQHADAAITHFLPEPGEQVPDYGESWGVFGISLTHENRRRVDLLKRQLKLVAHARPYRCYIAEALRRYLQAVAPDLVEELPAP